MPRVVAPFVVRVPPPLQVLLDLARVRVRVGVGVGVRVRVNPEPNPNPNPNSSTVARSTPPCAAFWWPLAATWCLVRGDTGGKQARYRGDIAAM